MKSLEEKTNPGEEEALSRLQVTLSGLPEQWHVSSVSIPGKHEQLSPVRESVREKVTSTKSITFKSRNYKL